MRTARRLDEIGTGLGPVDIPYSQAGQGDPAMPMLDPEQQQAAIASMQTNNGPGAEMEEDPTLAGGPEAMGAGMPAAPAPDAGAGPTTDQIPTEGLQQMVGGAQQDPQVAEVIAAMEDPNTDPTVLQNIEAMLAMAARRRMAGV